MLIFKTYLTYLNNFHMLYFKKNQHLFKFLKLDSVAFKLFSEVKELLSCYTSIQCTHMEYNFEKKILKYKILTENKRYKIYCNHIITSNVIRPCLCVYSRKKTKHDV